MESTIYGDWVRLKRVIYVTGFFLLIAIHAAEAQWLTRSISLEPGWNAVYLDATPYPASCDAQFTNTAIDTVWKWNRSFSTVQFIDDPSQLIKPSDDWLMWRSPEEGVSYLDSLVQMQANRAYLIHVKTNAAGFVWRFKGRITVPDAKWYPYALNLMGFPVNPENPPTVGAFFEPTDEVSAGATSDAQVYAINPDGSAEWIRSVVRYTIEPHKAYWVGANNPGGYSGPLAVSPKGGLDFGQEVDTLEFSVQNLYSDRTLQVTLRPCASETAPEGQPEVAGSVPLSYFRPVPTNSPDSSWVPLKAEGLSASIEPLQYWTLLLAVRRADMAAYAPAGTNGAAYQSWLELTDSKQSLLTRIPVIAEKETLTRADTPDDDIPATYQSQGLWFGGVSLDQVSSPYFSGTNLLSTPSPFNFALMLHVDGSGKARLLQHVTLALAQDGSSTSEYSYVLLSGMDPSTPTDSPAVNRLACAAFPVMEPLELTGEASLTNGPLTGQILLDGNDPMNPFLHIYHPMHDNQNAEGVRYKNAVETLEVTRNITIEPHTKTNAVTSIAHSIWGTDFVEGTYREKITGLQTNSVIVQGVFYLRRISKDGTLE